MMRVCCMGLVFGEFLTNLSNDHIGYLGYERAQKSDV
jgi:hypothetical protein